jgi:acetolactate synthase-1/2/3 large subunit
MEIGFGELNISKWSMDYGRLQPCTIRALGDPALAVPELTRLCRRRIDGDAKLATRVRNRAADVGKRHDALVQRYQEKARADWDASPITLPRLAAEVWQAIEHEDWVLTAGTLRSWARKLWNFDQPYRHPGKSLGTATQIGISLGVALAHKGTGRLVVDLQPDGDLMFDAGALWVAAKHEIPMLVVMFNNRAYYNDWEHQARMARKRGTDVGRAHIGMDLFGPAPDFAGLARSMGCCGEGPIERPQDIAPALRRAIAEVKKGRLALVDTVTQHR